MKAWKRNWLFLKAAITARVPVYVQYAVTKRCNLNCRMCQTTASRREEEELNLARIGKLAEVLERIGAGILILTGGEPLLRRDLSDIVRLFTQRGITVRLQTNAVISELDRLRKLIAAGLEAVTISLHSLYPEITDRITGVKGSWELIMKGLANWLSVLPGKGNLSGINITVSRLNLEELPALVAFVSHLGLYASVIPVHLSGGDTSRFIVRAEAPECGFTFEDHPRIAAVYDRLIKMKKRGFRIYNSYRFLRESRTFLKTGRISWKCLSPDLYYSISPQGHFLPCVDISTDISMLADDFVARYRSGEIREKIKTIVRSCPGCMYACYPEITYLCRDAVTFLERIGFALKAGRTIHRKLSHDELIAAAERFRG